MSGFKSTYLRDKILDHVYGKTTFTAGATLYLRLYTVAPTVSGGGTEVTGGSYAPVAVTNNTTNFPNSSGATKHNGTLIDFGTASADWGIVVGAAWWDASSGGNMYAYGPFGTPVTVLSGAPFSIAINAGTFTEA